MRTSGVGLARWILAAGLAALAVPNLMVLSSQDEGRKMMSSMLLLLIEPWAVIALALGIALRIHARHARALAFTRIDWVLVVLASVGIVGDITWNIWVLRGSAPAL